jgi:hypothetical protein
MASALRRLVAEIENACAEGLRLDKLQCLLIATLLKQTLSAPYDYGCTCTCTWIMPNIQRGLYSIQK